MDRITKRWAEELAEQEYGGDLEEMFRTYNIEMLGC